MEQNIFVLAHFGVPFCGLLVFYFIYIHIFLYILLVKTHIIYKKNLKIISLYITINISILSLNIYPIIIIITINTFLEYKNINMNFFRDKYELFFIKYKYRSTSHVLSNYRSLRFCSFFFFFTPSNIYIYINLLAITLLNIFLLKMNFDKPTNGLHLLLISFIFAKFLEN